MTQLTLIPGEVIDVDHPDGSTAVVTVETSDDVYRETYELVSIEKSGGQ